MSYSYNQPIQDASPNPNARIQIHGQLNPWRTGRIQHKSILDLQSAYEVPHYHSDWSSQYSSESLTVSGASTLSDAKMMMMMMIRRYRGIKPGFHYGSRAVVNLGAFFDTGVDGCQKMHPRWRPVNGPSTRVHFLTPVNSGVKKCTRVHGPWTRTVETGLNSHSQQLVQ